MNLRKAVKEFLRYADTKGIRRLYEVLPRWLLEHYPSIYRSNKTFSELESVLHKNDTAYRRLPVKDKARIKKLRTSLYDKIALSVFKPCSCIECGKPIVLKGGNSVPINLRTAVSTLQFCSRLCSTTSNVPKAKAAKTNLRKYGVTCTLNSASGIRLKHKTWKQKYGVINPSHSPEIVGKILRSRYGHKTLRIAGKTFTYQGYENVMLRFLVRNLKVDPAWITTSPGKVRMFEYRYSGKSLKYLPDIKAKLGEKVWYFEIKSLLTLNSSRTIRDRVVAKAKSMWALKKNYCVVLCSNTKILAKAKNKVELDDLLARHQRW